MPSAFAVPRLMTSWRDQRACPLAWNRLIPAGLLRIAKGTNLARSSEPRSAANRQAFLHSSLDPGRRGLIRCISLAPRTGCIKIEAAGRKARGVPSCTDTHTSPRPTWAGFVAEVQPRAAKRPGPSGRCWLRGEECHRQNRSQSKKLISHKPHGFLHRSRQFRPIPVVIPRQSDLYHIPSG